VSVAVVAIVSGATFLVGLLVGAGSMWFLHPAQGASPEPSATASAAVSATAAPEPSAEPSATASAQPKIDPAAAARARRLAELRKKVKVSRATQLDEQCKRYKSSFGTGYVYDGGTFAENEMVANASGCVALAKASKAPWFCCPK
jgi:hypothetical protein